MNYSAGYAKDAIAAVAFVGAFVLVYNMDDLRKIKPVLLMSLVLAMIIDGAFTFRPEYHNIAIGYNLPTYLIIATMLAYIPILTIFFNTYYI